jgi:hypothetical protein
VNCHESCQAAKGTVRFAAGAGAALRAPISQAGPFKKNSHLPAPLQVTDYERKTSWSDISDVRPTGYSMI